MWYCLHCNILPCFVVVYDLGEHGSEVSACTDEENEHHQHALEVEDGTLCVCGVCVCVRVECVCVCVCRRCGRCVCVCVWRGEVCGAISISL